MRVREAVFGDIRAIVEMLERADAEFGHESVPFCHDTTRNTLQRVINQREHAAFLLVGNDDSLQGILVGLCNQVWMSRKREIVDLVYYVREESRGHGSRLMIPYLAWARNTPNVCLITMGITSGIDTEERIAGLFESSGFKRAGSYYVLHPAEAKKDERHN